MEPEETGEVKAKTCATCVHLRGKRFDPSNWKTWQCFKSNSIGNLVSGLKDYELCIDVRNSVTKCFVHGDWYEEYVPPVRTQDTSIDTNNVENTFSESDLARAREAAQATIAARKATKSLANITPKEL